MRGERGACGDYTDLTRLRYAYTTHLAPSGKALMPPAAGSGLDLSVSASGGAGGGGGADGPPFPPPPRLSATTISMLQDAAEDAAGAGAAGGGGGNNNWVQHALSSVSLVGSEVSTAATSGGGGPAAGGAHNQVVKIRVPSYTDRIWIHSLPLLDRALSFQAYELCDALWESDHRPVSAILHLDLRPALDARRAVIRAYTPPPPPPPPRPVRERSQSGGSGMLPKTPTAVRGAAW